MAEIELTVAGAAALSILALAINLGVLRQLGLLQLEVAKLSRSIHAAPAPVEGPPIGSPLPDLTARSVNTDREVSLGNASCEPRAVLLVFLSAMCDSCTQLVGPLNALVSQYQDCCEFVVVMIGSEYDCANFDRVYPIAALLIADPNRLITIDKFSIHRPQFALYYGTAQTLLHKGPIEDNLENVVRILSSERRDSHSSHPRDESPREVSVPY